MTPPYRFISFTALLLTSGTRKRPPQSGSVQTGFGAISLQLTDRTVRGVGGRQYGTSEEFETLQG